MRQRDPDMPCGCCDMGTYSEAAMLNPVARKFGAKDATEREASFPKCKKFNRECVGAKHFHQALIQLDESLGVNHEAA